MKKLKTREIALAAGLAAISAVVQLIHIGYQSPQFGMWIDVVAVTWIIGIFLFGPRMAFIVSAMGAIMITLFAPDTWLGASMKWLASFPVWLLLGTWTLNKKKPFEYYKKWQRLLIPLILAIVIRCLIIIPMNYFYAIPIWTGLTPAKAMIIIPWQIIAIFNIVQSFVDVGVAWILVYKFGLNRFAPKETQKTN
jgi:riboflavin transporter FmnP